MPDHRPHPAAIATDELLRECDIEFLRRSGPGGQHRNKVETGVRLLHSPSGVRAQACERRSQAANRRVAIFRLRINLALEVRRPVDPEYDPSDRWKERSAGGLVRVNPSHDDFPALLAEALDTIATFDGDVSQAARRLECTPSQMVRFLKKDSRAIGLVNNWRESTGARPLRQGKRTRRIRH
jgi:peptide chain release factor-like protein